MLDIARQMLDIYEFYEKMEQNNILLSFKGDITSDLLTSILQIMEHKLDNLEEAPKVKKKVYNILVECLQNLYHHMDEMPDNGDGTKPKRSAIFMIGQIEGGFRIITGNYLFSTNVNELRSRIDKINGMEKEELKAYYKEVLNNGQMSEKGGGGLGMIDIARKSGQKLEYSFMEVEAPYSFFTLNIFVAHNINWDIWILWILKVAPRLQQ